MNRRIVYGRVDGGVSIVIPARNVGEEHLSDDEILQRAWDKLPEEIIDPRIITVDQIPQDRTFRGAWKLGVGKVVVDMTKARDIHLGRIREARDAKLKELDVETIKALGQGDKIIMDAVEGQKRRLRNLPQTFDLSKAKTPEELQALWPDELKGFL